MRQALEMALEFIERVNKDGWILADFEPEMYNTITAIKEALAQPEQQSDVSHKLKFDCEFVDGTCADLTVYGSERDIKRLEARVKFWWNLEQHSGTPDSDKAERIRLGKPPQRTWVGLTEAQCGVLWKTNMTPFEYYQAIEAKLKEKNT